jgi:hypothetical protein
MYVLSSDQFCECILHDAYLCSADAEVHRLVVKTVNY